MFVNGMVVHVMQMLRVIASVMFALGALCVWCTVSLAMDNGYRILTVEEPPASFTGEDGPQGYIVDMVRAMQRRMGDASPIEIVPERRALDLAAREPNVVFFGFSRVPEREQQYRWIALVLEKPWVFFSRSPLPAPEVLRMLRVGCKRGDVREGYLKDHGFSKIDATNDHRSGILKLLNYRLDAILYDQLGMAYDCKQLGVAYDVFYMSDVVAFSDVYIAMSAASSDASYAAWVKAYHAIVEDGTAASIGARWVDRIKEWYGIDCTFTRGRLRVGGHR